MTFTLTDLAIAIAAALVAGAALTIYTCRSWYRYLGPGPEPDPRVDDLEHRLAQARVVVDRLRDELDQARAAAPDPALWIDRHQLLAGLAIMGSFDEHRAARMVDRALLNAEEHQPTMQLTAVRPVSGDTVTVDSTVLEGVVREVRPPSVFWADNGTRMWHPTEAVA